MKKYLFFMLLAACCMSLASCSSDDDNNDDNKLSEKEAAMSAITTQYVNNVVFPIYQSLAAQTSDLFDQLVSAKTKFRAGTLTQKDIDQICNTFINARSAWESSESFLYGAATDFGIDPHIDTWPLDRTALAKALSSAEIIDDLDDLDDGGIDNARALVGEQQLGFHGIEFIIFRNGKNRTLAELIFAAAVAGDLRDKCFQLEVSWLGDKAPKSHQDRVEECEFPTTVAGGDSSYGENMLNATKAGSTLATWRGVMSTILVAGCSNICAEVAGQKIGQAYLGTDPDYIESPYSQRSYYDFFDNISSIQYSLYGQTGTTAQSNSIMAYLQKYNASMAANLKSKLDAALLALSNAKAGTPFVVDSHSTAAKAAPARFKPLMVISNSLRRRGVGIAHNH